MDFSLSDHQLLIRDTVREFMNTEVRPHVKDWERTDHFPLDAIRKLGELGCCGMLMPEEYGGAALDHISYVLMLEEVARVHTALSTALSVTNSAVQIPLLTFGTEAQKDRYLRRLATGEILGSFCLTEAGAGSDAANIQTRAQGVCSGRSLDGEPAPAAQGESVSPAAVSSTGHESQVTNHDYAPLPFSTRHSPLATRHPDPAAPSSTSLPAAVVAEARHQSPVTSHYILNGTKTWVTNGSAAGVYLVFAKTNPELAGKGITAFLVEPTFLGFKIGRHEDKMGQRSSPSVEILLNDCVVPAENRLGEEGQGLRIALSALDAGRIGIAAQAVGLAQGALDESVKYARARKAFGKSIGEFQAIQWMLADMHTDLEAARALLYHAASLKDQSSPLTPARHSEPASAGEESLSSFTSHQSRITSHSSRAKLYASEMVNRVVYKAVQIHGALGYSRESEVERMYRDARVISIYEGTSEIQRTIIARDLLKS